MWAAPYEGGQGKGGDKDKGKGKGGDKGKVKGGKGKDNHRPSKETIRQCWESMIQYKSEEAMYARCAVELLPPDEEPSADDVATVYRELGINPDVINPNSGLPFHAKKTLGRMGLLMPWR